VSECGLTFMAGQLLLLLLVVVVTLV